MWRTNNIYWTEQVEYRHVDSLLLSLNKWPLILYVLVNEMSLVKCRAVPFRSSTSKIFSITFSQMYEQLAAIHSEYI